MMIFGLDHMVTEQEASAEEIEAVRKFLTREGTCLMIGPHHDVGVSSDPAERQMEYAAPRRSLGSEAATLRPLHALPYEGTGRTRGESMGPAPCAVAGDESDCSVDRHEGLGHARWLTGVTTFNFHPHLPHYALTTDDAKLIRVLARQPIDMSHPHPFTEAGNREFNTFLWMPPSGTRAGDILLVDLTMFTTLFGGTESLDRFWNNLATRT